MNPQPHKQRTNALLCVALVLLLPAVALGAEPSFGDNLLRFTGRLHPALVHFPIGLIVTGAILELLHLARRKPGPSPAGITCVVIGAITAAAAAFGGWMNADFEAHGAEVASTIFWHRWLGIIAAATCAIAAILAIPSKVLKPTIVHRIYSVLLVVTAGLVSITGYLGGNIVYGPDHLFEVFRSEEKPAPAPNPPAEKPSDKPVDKPSDGTKATPPDTKPPETKPQQGTAVQVSFTRDVKPIFEDRCINCHGPSRSRGRLRLDSTDRFVRTDGTGIVKIGDADNSELVKRVELPDGERGHMPQRGGSLSQKEIETIRAWINTGAQAGTDDAPATPPADTPKPPKPEETKKPDETKTIQPDPTPTGTNTPSPALLAAAKTLRDLGARIEPVAADSPDLDANLSLGGSRITDDSLASLTPLFPNLKSLSLARTAITDKGLASLADAAALESLHLEGTAITDAGLASLTKLPRLSYLNLHSTKITDAGLRTLASLKPLRKLYVWGTGVTEQGVAELKKANAELTVETGTAPKPPAEPAPATPTDEKKDEKK